jgi:hypothetical protein
MVFLLLESLVIVVVVDTAAAANGSSLFLNFLFVNKHFINSLAK